MDGKGAALPRSFFFMKEQVGRTFVFNYGELVVKVRYLSDSRLRWEQLKGPSPGLKGEEKYSSVPIRPHVYLLWWQEPDKSVIAQVVDFETWKVHTVWVSPQVAPQHFSGNIQSSDLH